MPEQLCKLPGFVLREPEDASDEKLLHDIREHGWHIVGIPDDHEGPGFSFTVGLYMRTLQPEILLMGLPLDTARVLLNSIAEHLMSGGAISPGSRVAGLIASHELLFQPIHPTHYSDFLGYANWFYRNTSAPFPALQGIWPDAQGRFPHEAEFDPQLADRQIDLSQARK